MGPETCRWFAFCEKPATSELEHPILGPVPVCDRCRRFALGVPESS